jgi:hypothetical protein
VFEYKLPGGGVRRELRLPDEVFKQDSLDSYDGAPLTDDHPDCMVDSSTARAVARGTVTQSGRRDGDMVATSMLVTDADTIKKMKAGKRELSVGYQVDLDETPGTHPEYGQYDAVQRNIVVNHLALVDVARAGREARVRLDAAEMVMADIDAPEKSCYTGSAEPSVQLKVIKMDELQKQLATALADAAQQKARADSAEKDRDAARTEIESQKARADSAEKDRDAALKARTDSEGSFEKRVDDAVQLRADVTPFLGAEFQFAGKTAADIKRALVEKVDGDKIATDAHEAYVDGMYTGAIKRAKAGAQALGSVRAAVPPGSERADEFDEEAAARRMTARTDGLWKQPAEGVK